MSAAAFHPLRRVTAGVLAILLLGTGLALSQSVAAAADPVVLQSGELVVNGDAEQPVSVGWTGSLGRATHGSGGYPASVIVDSSGATGATYPGGTALFTGVGGSSTASQTIDLTPSAAAIDNGHVDALLSAYVGGYATQRDNATLTYTFRDASSAAVATVIFGPVLTADRGNTSGFIGFSQTQTLPAGTRSVVITITTQRFTAPANDGYVDNVSLILDAPSPVATADNATTNQGVSVTLTPYSNDTPGAGAAILPSSVRLLNGTLPVTTLTTADGTYVVDTSSGDVEFTPAGGFYGTTTAVPYRITDSSGQTDDSTLTVDVAFVAAPALTLAKSASPSDPDDYLIGTEITYSFVVTNTGNVTIDNLIITEGLFTGSDPLPAAACPVTTLMPGAQTTCTAIYTLTADDAAAGGVNNTATASGTPDGTATPIDSNPSSFAIPVAPAPAIALTKTANAAGASAAGDPVAYSFLVANTGNVAVDTVSISENTFSGTGAVPTASCPAVTLIPGEFTTCTATYALTQPDIDAGTVTNTATASAAPASGGSISSPQSSASVTIAPAPAFTFTKSADRSSITAAGQAILYTFRITNTGNVTLSNPVVNEATFTGAGTLGAITCANPTVTPTATLNCTATYTTVTADLDEANVSNSATANLDDPLSNTLSSALSVVAVPIILPDPGPVPGTIPGNPVLPATGADILPLAFFGGALLLAGLSLLGVALLRRSATLRDPGRDAG